MKMFSPGFFVLVEREILRFLHLWKQTIMPGLISSGLYILVFGHALGSRIGEIKNISYMNYIIPGLVMMSVINHAYQNSSSSLMQAKFLKFLDDLLITPLSGFEISVAYIIGATCRGLINGTMVILLSMVLTDFTIDNILLTSLYLIIVSWAFGAMGVIVGIYAKTWDHIGMFTTFVFMPLSMLGGVFWSIEMLPEFWQTISMFNPLYWMINGLRYATLGVGDTSPEISLIISVTFAITFSAIASIMFSKGYRIRT
jgi:ABC-2 type transport system permease protein